MRKLMGGGLMILSMASMAVGQPPPGRDGGGRERSAGDVNSFLNRLMAFDSNQDGKLAKDELKDARLHALFERADADKDGVATKDELTALFEKESAALGRGGPGGGAPGFGGGPGGPGFGGGPGGRPLGGPGQVLPAFLQEALNLTDAQRKQVEELQNEVDTKLAKILTDAQRQQLREMRERGPGGPGFGPGGARPGPEGRPGGAPDRRPPQR